MQPMWISLLSGRRFEEAFENTRWWIAFFGTWNHLDIAKRNAACVTLPALIQALWENIWKHTVEKSQTNATSVIMHLFRQAIWGNIWKPTVEKSQTNATNVILHPLMQVLWGHILKHTAEDAGDLRRLLKIHCGEKLNKCNSFTLHHLMQAI